MITKYRAYFKSEIKLPPYLGAIFQSILLEAINLELAQELHDGEHSLRPYHSALYLSKDNEYVWDLIALNENISDAFFLLLFIFKHQIGIISFHSIT